METTLNEVLKPGHYRHRYNKERKFTIYYTVMSVSDTVRVTISDVLTYVGKDAHNINSHFVGHEEIVLIAYVEKFLREDVEKQLGKIEINFDIKWKPSTTTTATHN
jgi:hypothetical protein